MANETLPVEEKARLADAMSGTVPFARRLSTKLLVLTVSFVLISALLIFPSLVASFRLQWLQQRLATAAAVSTVLLQTGTDQIPQAVQRDVLMATGVKAIAVREGGVSRLMVVSHMPPKVDMQVNLDDTGPWEAISGAADTLFFGGNSIIRAYGKVGESDKEFELILSDRRLHNAMLEYARNTALLSLLISAITAGLVYASIHALLVRPIRNFRNSMLAFAAAPDDPNNIIRVTGRADELGVTEHELAGMQTQLQRILGEQKHLADLGLAVSKINHDMRNILASAQLISDRLRLVKDPTVQTFAPKLLRALDRAVSYSEGVLAYGRTQEPAPVRRRIRLRQLVDEVHSMLPLDQASDIEFENRVDPAFEVDADSEQLFRVLNNLCRNAVQAMSADSESALVRRLTISAERVGAVCTIFVADTGPGLPPKARDNLFSAFRGSARSGGTGLGLAIAYELVRAHGGSLKLVESVSGRTVFSITIADRPVSLEEVRQGLRSA
ncbi:HAMP domain-containing sensor histidine kinase [Mesorhizobium sp. BAC0120]|nr:HAMP domain-containing sensor histidine kinase [Mesorhizobium sp. BAC0120]MDW6025386.1 HAMP domain-containing sensor histidine kinase [Mesorhizobium sp. BAC0120]